MSSHMGDLRRNTIRQLQSIVVKLEEQSAKWEGTENYIASELAQLSMTVARTMQELRQEQRKRQKRR